MGSCWFANTPTPAGKVSAVSLRLRGWSSGTTASKGAALLSTNAVFAVHLARSRRSSAITLEGFDTVVVTNSTTGWRGIARTRVRCDLVLLDLCVMIDRDRTGSHRGAGSELGK